MQYQLHREEQCVHLHRPPLLVSVEHNHMVAVIVLIYTGGSTVITSYPPLLPVSSGDEDFLEITEYLIAMEKTDVYNLGLVLGLSQHKVVTKMDSKTFLDDVITAWLRKEDQVIKRGEPSWRVLVSALKHRRVGQTGIATKIAMDKGLLL